MTWREILSTGGPILLALIAAYGVDRVARQRGLDPPGFADPVRRLAAGGLVALVLWLVCFAQLGSAGGGAASTLDFAKVSWLRLFSVQIILVATLAGWYLLGFAGFGALAPGSAASPAAQFGWRHPRPGRELGLGLFLGLATWSLLIGLVLLVALAVAQFAGEEALPKSPPPAILWIVGLPAPLRLAISLSAGAVEESFFRGFLQPRLGAVLSTLFFVLAHLSYGSPFLLVGVTLLSLMYALIVRLRQSILAAAVAHAAFDSIELLVVAPLVLRLIGHG
ncbi:MAG: CPBP family intramembrane glutamic endopeptidase [Acidobacteriota bacterium]